jgi:hypothetical protein
MAVDGCAAQGESQAAAQAFLACMKSDDDAKHYQPRAVELAIEEATK